MVAIFYNKKMLNDTLIINISNKKIISHITNDNFVIGYSNENEVSYINIFNFSKFMHLLDGYVRLDEKLCLGIKKQYLFPNANLGLEKITEIKIFI